MSAETKTETQERRWPRAAALVVAEALVDLLKPYCVRIEIAGSLRRGKADVGDVEICYVSKVGDLSKVGELFAAPGLLADAFINELLVGKLAQRLNAEGNATWGNLNKLAVHRATGLPVDLFREPKLEDWFRTLVIRTGPKDFNLRLIAGAKERGLVLHAYGESFSRVDSLEPVQVTSEKHFLELCGFDWIEPKERR